MKRTLYWDTETWRAGREIELGPRKFVRLMTYAWDDGPVQSTTDYDEMLELVRSADYVVAHNQISADLTWLFGYDSLEPLYMAMQRKVIDTFYLGNLLTPAPPKFTMRSGRVATETTDPVSHAMLWLSLDNLCYQFNLEGKLGDLKEIAKRYNPPKTPVRDLEYGLIDLDDPEFRMYAEQDVIAVRSLYKYLLSQIKRQEYPGDYIWREMEAVSALAGQMHRNGINVDVEFAKGRIAQQEARREELMAKLVAEYDFPTGGKSPWATTKGKEATLQALADYGFTPENTPEWPLTPTGAPKLGGKDLLLFTEGTDAEDFVRTLGELKGQRSTAQLVLDNLKPDGRVHPDISSLQRSGRYSFTRPGVTIFGDRTEELRQDKSIFRASEGNVMVGFDYSSADARAMAALSGDEEYARRFAKDADGNDLYDSHNLTGEAVFGADAYYGDGPRDKSAKPPLRAVAKVVGHSQNYQIGAYKLATQLNLAAKKDKLDLFFWAPAGKSQDGKPKAKPIVVPDKFKHVVRNDALTGEEIPEGMFLTRDMIDQTNQSYPWLAQFKERAYREAEAQGYITNPWGRRIHVPPGREFTGGPAAYGQGVTTEKIKDAVIALIRKGEYYIRALRALIHDELLMEFNEETVERDIAVVKSCMETPFDPKTNVSIVLEFPVGVGVGKTWKDAAH